MTVISGRGCRGRGGGGGQTAEGPSVGSWGNVPWWRSGAKLTRTKVYHNSISPKQPTKFLMQYGFVQASWICVNLKNNPCPSQTDGILSFGGKIWCLTLLYDLAISQSVNSGNFQSCKALRTFHSWQKKPKFGKVKNVSFKQVGISVKGATINDMNCLVPPLCKPRFLETGLKE